MKNILNLKVVAILCAIGGIISCEKSTFIPAQNFEVEINQPKRDTVFRVSNTNEPASLKIQLEGNLSHLATLAWDTDSTFKNETKIALIGDMSGSGLYTAPYTGNGIFFKYQPQNDSISGNLKIKVVVQ